MNFAGSWFAVDADWDEFDAFAGFDAGEQHLGLDLEVFGLQEPLGPGLEVHQAETALGIRQNLSGAA